MKSQRRSIGVPFWIGYVISLIAFCIFMVELRIWDGGLVSWLSVGCAAFVAVGPFGGVVLQALHDLIVLMCQAKFLVGVQSRFPIACQP